MFNLRTSTQIDGRTYCLDITSGEIFELQVVPVDRKSCSKEVLDAFADYMEDDDG
jgi:hypothetical protein